MKIKAGASIAGLQWQMFSACIICEPILKKYGEPELVITGGTEDAKGRLPKSLHKKGLANDWRSRNIPKAKREACRAELAKALGPDYDVVLESDHFHVEYQP